MPGHQLLHLVIIAVLLHLPGAIPVVKRALGAFLSA